MKKTIYTFVLGVFASTLAIAQDSTKADVGKFSVNGYIDSYYLTAFNNPKSGQLLGAGAGRAFDRLSDQFALGLVQTKFSYTNRKSELVIDLTFGPNAELGNFGNQRPTPGQGFVTGYFPTIGAKQALYGTSAAIKQAYFTYKFTDKFSMTIGQFGTHIGYEVIDAPVNFNYSLSNLFNNGPFYHVGGKLNYAFSDKFGIMVGLVNNWDALTDWKKSKSVVGQIFISPVQGWNVYLNFIGGANDDGFGVAYTAVDPNSVYPNLPVTYTRELFDLTTGYQITDRFYMGLNAAYGMYNYNTSNIGGGDMTFADGSTGKTAAWYGVAVYPQFKITDAVSIGGRYEYFSDSKGVRYIGYQYNGLTNAIGSTTNASSAASVINQSITLTLPITLADGHLILKPEFRLDIMNAKVYNATSNSIQSFNYYDNKDGGASVDQTTGSFTGGSKTQSTLGMAFIYKY